MEDQTKVSLRQVEKNGDYIWLENQDKNGEYYIFRSKSDEEKNIIFFQNEWVDYHTAVFYNESNYESLSFKENVSKELVESIFNLVASNLWTLHKIYGELKKIVSKNVLQIPSVQKVRGAIAEIKMYKKYGLEFKFDENSIYDFFDEDGDVEIKSFSKVERVVYISFQQLTNNPNAKFYLVEVFENSDGVNVRELYDSIPDELKIRYVWILNASQAHSNKYVTGEIIQKNAAELSENLVMPKDAIDAKFAFKI